MRIRSRITAFALSLALATTGVQARSDKIRTVRDAEIERTLERMSAPIFSAAGLSDGAVELFLIQDKALNAFVIGRNMAFHTGLLIALEDPEELLGVIAHEAGHIAGGHGVRTGAAVETASGAAILSTILGVAAIAAGAGQAGAAIFAGGQTIAQRGFLKYTRGQESSADQAAVTYLESARIDPGGMLETLERLKARELVTLSGRDPYVYSHPLSQERIMSLRNRVANSPARGKKADGETAYWHQRMRAKLKGFLLVPSRVLREIPDDGSEYALLARAVAYHRSPDPRAALATVDRLIALRPNDAYYMELKGQILFEGGFAREAVAPLRRAVALAPDEALILSALGKALLASNDPAVNIEARDVLRESTRRDRFDSTAWRLLAQAEGRLGNEQAASLAAAEHQVMTGREKVAARHAKKVQASAPEGSPAWIRASDILAEIERREELSR